MRILALDSAIAKCSATIVIDGEWVAGHQRDLDRGHASVLPVMAQACLREAGLSATDLDFVAVTVGPGSFTGIRGGVALAQGIGVAIGRPVIAVTVGEALAAALPSLGGRVLWCVVPSRSGRIFLETGADVFSLAVNELPVPRAPLALAGPAAPDIASRLAARGADVMLTDARLPLGQCIAEVAERRFRGAIRPLPPEPLYVDLPQARLPTAVAPPMPRR